MVDFAHMAQKTNFENKMTTENFIIRRFVFFIIQKMAYDKTKKK
jgi:hypothetical protein